MSTAGLNELIPLILVRHPVVWNSVYECRLPVNHAAATPPVLRAVRKGGTARLATVSGALIVLDYSRLNDPFKCRHSFLFFSFFFPFLPLLIIINAFTRSERKEEDSRLLFHFDLTLSSCFYFSDHWLLMATRMVDSYSSSISGYSFHLL